MPFRRIAWLLGLGLIVTVAGCDSSEDDEDLRSEVVVTYANIVSASYEDSYSTAQTLDQAVDAFIAGPSAATLEAAKQAWLAAREPYGRTEAFRFAGGPIDDADGPEGLLNAWPMDEAYVDYVEGDPTAGIINDPETYPTIDQDLIESLNEVGAEENISTGFHAIEFLLWGQDLSSTGAGARPFTDYTTADNADRRADFLAAASDLLLVHLKQMVDEWDAGASGNYRATFLALDEDRAIANMMTGIGTLAKSELAVERMFVAVNNQDQEDEHSCFSDNTHRDIITNAEGVANVWRGSYTRVNGSTVSGTSLSDLVADVNSDVASDVDGYVSTALSEVNAIPVPFDNAIISSQSDVLSAVDALQDLGDGIVVAASEIGIAINAELPD